MKATALLLLLGILYSFAQEPPKSLDIGPDHRLWESVEQVATEDGNVLVTNRVEQVETGLNFLGPDGTWMTSSPRLEVAKDGSSAFARNLQYQIFFAPSPLAETVFDVTLPDGQRLAGRVLGLGYVNVDGESVLIAEPVEVTGKITGPEGNEVIFPSAFSGGIDADLIYRVDKGGMSQNVLLRSQIQPPTAYGLSDKSVLTLFTEFSSHPEMERSSRVVQDADQDHAELTDEEISLGTMMFRTGRAFTVGKENQALTVSKSISVLEGRTFLLEKLPWVEVNPKLEVLPAVKPDQAGVVPLRKRTLQAALRDPPKGGQASFAIPRRGGVAAMSSLLSGAGFLWDYELATTTSSKTWIADRTYWLSGPVFVTNSVAEGGAILKMTNGAKLTIAGPSVWPNDIRPVVITSVGDRFHGENIGTNAAPGGFIADVALEFTSSQTSNYVRNVRILNAKKGISFAAGTGHTLRHVQMVNVGVGVEGASGVAYKVQNALFHQVLTNFLGSGSTAHVSHLTANTADWLSYSNQVTVNLTNSLIVAVANSGSATTNAVTRVATTNGVFQAVGAGYGYPAAGYILSGTNAIDSSLATDLAQRTVYPPTILTNSFTSNTTLSNQVARDATNFWRGFHYVPLDYAWSALNLTNSTLTLTNGISVGFYGDRGLILQNGGKVVSYGGPTNTVRWSYHNTVQEQPVAWGTNTSFAFLRVGSYATLPSVLMRFTDVSVMGNQNGKRTFISDSSASLTIRDSWLRSVMIYSFGTPVATTIGLTNNFIHRGEFSAWQHYFGSFYPLTLHVRNNLFLGNTWTVEYGRPSTSVWGIYDNFFADCAMSAVEADPGHDLLPNSNNGYKNTSLLPSGFNNVVVTTLDWAAGPSGDYYYPKDAYGESLATLIDRGSGLAKDVGLYHFTTLTDGSREGFGINDIGFHYAATYQGTNVYNDDGDSLLSLLEDINGNGILDSGESGWYPPTLILTNPPPAYFVSSPAVTLDPTATIDDIDAVNYAEGQLTVDLVYTVRTNDRIEIISQGTGPGQIGVSGASVSFQGTPFATFLSSSNGTKIVITFTNTPAASLLAARALVRSVGYINVSVTPDFMHRTARFQFSDGYGATSAYAYKAIQIGCAPKLDVVFLIDRTGTLSPSDFTQALGAAKTMLDYLDLTKDQVSVLSFCGGITDHLGGGFSTNKSILLSAISGIVQTNGDCTTTYVDNSVDQAQLLVLDVYRRTNAQPLLLLITDGIDYADFPTNGSISSKIKGTRILSFGVGDVISSYLKIEASCEADYYSGSSSNALAAAMWNVAGQLCRGNNTAPTITLVNPTNNATYAVPAQIELRADAADPGGRISKVEFYQGSTKVGEDLWAPYSTFLSIPTPGTYVLSAVATDDTGLRVSSAGVTVVVAPNGSRTYTRNVDFASGSLLNVNFDAKADELTLNRTTKPYPYVNVALTGAGSMRRLEAGSGIGIGEYYTAPTNYSRSPMAIAVDKLGNVWVANMSETNGNQGSVTCIGLVVGGTRGNKVSGNFVADSAGQYLQGPFLYNTCIDRDGDGLIRTSKGSGDRLGWSGTTISTADDEAILYYVRTTPLEPWGIAIDQSNDVWVSGRSTVTATRDVFMLGDGIYSTYSYPYFFSAFQKIGGVRSVAYTPGVVVSGSYFTNTAGGASTVVDNAGVLWSATELPDDDLKWGIDGLLRHSFSPLSNQLLGDVWWLDAVSKRTVPQTNGAAALGIDPATGQVWFSGFHEDYVWKLPLGGNTGAGWNSSKTPQGDIYGCGVAVDERGNVWIAHNKKHGDGPKTVGHVKTSGVFVGNLTLCEGSGGTGVSIDSNGKVWVVTGDAGFENAIRINPNGGPKMLSNALDDTGYPVGSDELTIALGAGSSPMSVGDMTGFVLLAATAPSGSWTVVHDGANTTSWGTISWHAATPTGSYLSVAVRAHSQRSGLAGQPWTPVVNGVALGSPLSGRFLEIQASFSRDLGSTNRSVLYDLTVTPAGQTPIQVETSAGFAKDDHFSFYFNQSGLLSVLVNDIEPNAGLLKIADYAPPSFGAVVNNGTNFSYVPATGFSGTDRFVYSATNAAGVKSWALVSILVTPLMTNDALPLAVDDVHTMPGTLPFNDDRRIIPVLSNDTNYVRIVSFQQGLHGTVDLANGRTSDCAGTNLTYFPNPYFAGYDSFTYSIANAQGAVRSATVRVHVTGDSLMDIGCGAVVNGSISPDDQMDADPLNLSNATDYYRIWLTNVQTLRIDIRRSDNPTLSQTAHLYGPDGVEIAIVSDVYPISETGYHLIKYSLPSVTSPIPYTLSLNCIETVPISTSPRLHLLAGDVPLTNNCPLNFGICDPAKNYRLTLTLINTGQVAVTLGTPSITGNFAISTVDSLPDSLSAGATKKVVLRFTPGNTTGLHTGSVSFTTDDPSRTTFTINLSGHAFSSRPSLVINSPTNDASTFEIPSSIPVAATMTSYSGSITGVQFVTSRIKVEEDYDEDPPFSWATSGLGTTLIANGVLATTNFYTNTWNYAGEQSARLLAIATDNAGNKGMTNAATLVDVTVASPDKNKAPIARDDFYVLPANSSNNSLKVLGNDQDPDNDSLRVISYTAAGFGTLVQNGQEFVYTPTANVIGTNSFSYEITDDHGHQARALVTLAVTPLAIPSIVLTNPVNGSQFTLPVSLTLAVTTNGAVQRVEFFVDNEKVGETNGPNYSIAWSEGTPGVHSIWAIATASNGLQASSDSALVTLYQKPGNRLPVALISNLTSTNDSSVNAGISLPMPPLVRDGLLDVRGTAKDPDSGDTNTYKIRVLSMKGEILRTFSFSGSKPGTNDLLGTIDLTSLQNGPYNIALEVRDGSDSAEDVRQILLDSQLKLGQFTFSEEDLIIPVSGFPLTVVRTYDSLNPNQGDFGYSWTYAINDVQMEINEFRQTQKELEYSDPEEAIAETGDTFSMRVGGGRDVTLTLPDGRRATFRFYVVPATQQAVCPSCYQARWEAPPGVYATLKTPGASTDVNVKTDNTIIATLGRPTWHAGGANTPWENYDIPKFILTTPDGTEYSLERESANGHDHYFTFDENFNPVYVEPKGKARLRLVKQRSNDLISIADNRIDHYNATNGLTRSLVFVRDSLGRISEVRDPVAGADGLPAVRYEYDSANGNLARVLKLVDRNLGVFQTNSYFYTNTTFPHYLTSVVDARGTNVARQLYDSTGKLTSVIDAEGRTTSFVHDLTGKTEKVVNRLGVTNSFSFDLRGNVLVSTVALGTAQARVDVFGYDNQGNKLVETNGFGTSLATWNSYGYNTNGLVLSSINALGYTNGFQYNGYGQLEKTWDAKGFVSTNVFDTNSGNLKETLSPYGRITRFAYDSANRLLMETNPLSTVTKSAYDVSGNITNIQVMQGSQVLAETQFTFDANGNRTSQRVRRTPTGGTTAQWLSTAWVYDGLNRVVMTIDPDGYTNVVYYGVSGKVEATTNKLGQVTRFEYGPRGLLSKKVWPDGSSETYGYDAEGRRTNVTDRASRPTAYQYDSLGRLTNTVFVDGTSNKIFYDVLGRVKNTIDANGVTNAAYGYDLLGRRTSVTNAWGIVGLQTVASSLYDANGNLTRDTDPSGNATDYSYDALNQRYQTDFPATVSGGARANVKARFDAAGQRVAETNEASVVTLYGFDALGRMTSVTNALGATEQTVTKCQFDEVGNMTNQVDALNRSTSFSYDAMNRRTWRRLPLGQLETFSYDPEGNLRQHFDFNGFVMTNRFDSLNRLISQHATNTVLQRIGYTSSGVRAGVTNWPGASGWEYAETFTYDSRDRLKTNQNSVGKLLYTYDNGGNLTSLKSGTASGVDVTYQYDGLNRLTNVVDNRITTNTAYKFDANGNLATLKLPNGVTNLWQYDSRNRLTNELSKLSAGTNASYVYKLAVTGHRTNLDEVLNGTSRGYAWGYDQLYRLKAESLSGGSTGTNGYTFDKVGNRLTRVTSVSGVTNQTFTYSSNDGVNTAEVYDSNGNATTSFGSALQYDHLNRLTNAGGTVVQYYSGSGNRVKKVVGATTTLYLVSDLNPTGYPQVVEELTVSGVTTNLSRNYTWGLGLISHRVASSGTNYFYGLDGHGSVRCVMNATGTNLNTYVFDAWGILVASTVVVPNNYLYAGEQWDPDLNLYYLRARFERPEAGRFINRDSFEGSPSDPMSLHQFLFSSDDPINNVDPSGHEIEGLLVGLNIGGVLGAMTPFTPSVQPVVVSPLFKGCNSQEIREIKDAVAEAKKYSQEAMQYLASITPNTSENRYYSWFGGRHSGRLQHVRVVWDKIDSALRTETLTFEAHQPKFFGSQTDYYGVVHPLRAAIRLGDFFWVAPLTGEDSRAGTIIHELSHKFGRTSDHEYGAVECRRLAKEAPSLAIENADSYEYFSELK